MKCPHCLIAFNEAQSHKLAYSTSDVEGSWYVEQCDCPECGKVILHLRHKVSSAGGWYTKSLTLIRPKSGSRTCPTDVPPEFADDFKESSLVISDSPKASAALSRRCLQSLLREKAKTTSKDLADQIEEIVNGSMLPSYLIEDLDAVRNIGNFAAHPIKSKQTGEVLPVEPGEAEWNLDVLESLFDYYFVQPELNKKRKDALNKKLAEAGKPQLK